MEKMQSEHSNEHAQNTAQQLSEEASKALQKTHEETALLTEEIEMQYMLPPLAVYIWIAEALYNDTTLENIQSTEDIINQVGEEDFETIKEKTEQFYSTFQAIQEHAKTFNIPLAALAEEDVKATIKKYAALNAEKIESIFKSIAFVWKHKFVSDTPISLGDIVEIEEAFEENVFVFFNMKEFFKQGTKNIDDRKKIFNFFAEKYECSSMSDVLKIFNDEDFLYLFDGFGNLSFTDEEVTEIRTCLETGTLQETPSEESKYIYESILNGLEGDTKDKSYRLTHPFQQKRYENAWKNSMHTEHDMQTMKDLFDIQQKENIEYKTRMQDTATLAQIGNNPELLALYQNREALVQTVEEVHDQAPAERKKSEGFEFFAWQKLKRVQRLQEVCTTDPAGLQEVYNIFLKSGIVFAKDENDNGYYELDASDTEKKVFEAFASKHNMTSKEAKSECLEDCYVMFSEFAEGNAHVDPAQVIQKLQDYVAVYKNAREYNKHYCERPEVSELPRVKLMQIHLLKEAIKSKHTKAQIGRLIWEDLNLYPTTEVGGRGELFIGKEFVQIDFSKQFSDKKEEFEDNGSYIGDSRKTSLHPDAAFDFHFHAINTDSKDYSGPSGIAVRNSEWQKGDIGSAIQLRANELVFTTMGHPKDADGNEIKGKLLVNLDFYWAEDNPEKPSVTVFDIGTFEVPYRPQ